MRLPELLIALGCAALLAIVAAAGACALLEPAAERLGKLTHDYCREELAVRLGLRAKANQYAAPHAIRITCAGDPPTTTTK